jgi:hypothetical protein
MTDLEIRGGYPQNAESPAGEVVLTRAESAYLTLSLSADQTDPFYDPDNAELENLRKEASLTIKQGRFIQDYLCYKGDIIELADIEHYEPSKIARYLASPAVRRILTEAARLCPELPPPIPTKEELAVTWGLVSRDPAMPLAHQREARQELAKLLGYYPHGDEGVKVGVQVVLKGDLTDD